MANVIEFNLKGRDQFSKPLKRVGESLRKVGRVAAIGIGVATTAFVALTVSSFRTVDALAKTADKLGVTTKALAGLQLASELTGVSAQTLDQGLKNMIRNIADFRDGTGEAADELKALGFEASALARLSPEQQFAVIGDALNKVTDNTTRVNAAFKIFGGRATALLNTLKLGTKGLEEIAGQADRLGIAISRVDAAKIEQANDAVTRLKAGFKGIGNQIAVKLAPFLKVLSDRFTKLIEETGGFKNIISNTFNTTIKGAAFVADAFNGLKIVFLSIKLAFAEVLNFVIQGSAKITDAVLVPLNAIADTKIGEKLGLQVIKPMEEIATVAAFRIQEIRNELDAAIIKPVPSDAIKLFAEEVTKTAQKTADEIARIQNASLGGEEGGTGAGSVLTEAMKKDMAGRLQVLKEGLFNEQETINLDFENKKIQLEEFKLNRLITEQEFTELMKQILFERNTALFDLEADAENRKFQLRKKAANANFKLIGDSANKNVAAFGAAEQAIFGQNKAAAIVNTGVSILRGIAKAQELPWPANLVEALRIGALGASLTAQLKGKKLSGSAQGGLENVPRTGTFLLHRGERVLSEPQNRELLDFIRSVVGGGSRNVTIENIDMVILPNATNVQALLDMDENEMREIVAGPIITALDQLEDQGVRPKSITRSRG